MTTSSPSFAPGFSLSLTDQWIVFDLEADGDVARALGYARERAAEAGEALSPDVERAMHRLFDGWAEHRDGLAFAALFHATDPELGAISASVTMEFSHAARGAYDEWISAGIGNLAFAEGREVICSVFSAGELQAIRTFERRTMPLTGQISQETGTWAYVIPATDDLAMVVRCTSPALEFAAQLGEMFDEVVGSLRFTAPSEEPSDDSRHGAERGR